MAIEANKGRNESQSRDRAEVVRAVKEIVFELRSDMSERGCEKASVEPCGFDRVGARLRFDVELNRGWGGDENRAANSHESESNWNDVFHR